MAEWKCALYVRVSSDRQASKEFSSLETQEDVLKKLVAEKNERRNPGDPAWKDVRTYVEAKSAKDTNRPAFQRMLRDVERGDINMIVFLRLDRFSRSLRDFLNLQDFLNEHNCGFASRHDPMLDTSTPHGEFITRLLLMLAEFERKLTAERTKEKMYWRAEQGLWNGSQVLGYDLGEQKGVLTPNAAEAEVVRFIFDTYEETHSLRLTAQRANARGYHTKQYTSRAGVTRGGASFAKGHVHGVLTNPVYTGKVRIKDHEFRGRHEAIISLEQFERVQKLLKKEVPRRRQERERCRTFLLQDLAVCGLCESALIPHYVLARDERHYYYRCRAMYDGSKECRLPIIRAEQLEELIISEVRGLACNQTQLEAAVRLAQQERDANHGGKVDALRAKQAELAKLKAQQANVVKFIKGANASPKELVTELDSLRDEIGRAESELHATEQALDVAPAVDLSKVEDYLKFFGTVYELMSDEDKRALLKTFVQKVECYEDKVQVYLYDEPSENDLKALTTDGQVCSIVQKSSPARTRTSNLAVNSRSLYH